MRDAALVTERHAQGSLVRLAFALMSFAGTIGFIAVEPAFAQTNDSELQIIADITEELASEVDAEPAEYVSDESSELEHVYVTNADYVQAWLKEHERHQSEFMHVICEDPKTVHHNVPGSGYLSLKIVDKERTQSLTLKVTLDDCR